LGAATGLQDAEAAVSGFRQVNWRRPSFWRLRLKCRVSSRKASRLARELFGTELESAGLR